MGRNRKNPPPRTIDAFLSGSNYVRPTWLSESENLRNKALFLELTLDIKLVLGTESRFAFSPDSRYMAYMALVNDRQFVVADGKEGKKYVRVLGKEKSIVFDSPDSFHYLTLENDSVYLVEQVEAIVTPD